MVSRILTFLLSVALAAALVAATGDDAEAQTTGCHEDSWIGGMVELCDGVLVYRDYVYDDHGANDPTREATAEESGELSGTAGEDRYPEGAEATADLVDLTLQVVGDELVATFELNALYEPDQTVAALVIDTDDDPGTGGGTWADGDHDLGITSTGWDVIAFFDEGDPQTNLLTGSVPLPEGDTWRVQAATAQADGTVMNVAFRGTDETTGSGEPGGDGTWFEGRQAAALEDGDVSEFGHTVEVADMTGGVTRPAELEPGYHERVYTSDHTVTADHGTGEGMGYEPVWGRDGDSGEVCEQAFHYWGRYQPYGIYVPEPGGDPYGMQLALHGCNANHSSLVGQPGMRSAFGDGLGRIVVVPLGRGPVGYYSDISERDVLDVMADVIDTYDVDTDRIFAGGYSMGGYGAYRLAQLYPHRFAGMVNWVGFTGDGNNNPTGQRPTDYDSGAVGNVIELVRNLEHIPSALLYAGADELVHTHTHTAMAQRFQEEGGAYEYFLHPYAEHLTFALVDSWEKEAAWTEGLTLEERPLHVDFRTAEWLGNPDLGIAHDRAYWLSAIRGREDAYIDLDVTGRCAGEVPVMEEGNDAGVGPAAFAWTSQYRRITGTEHAAGSDTLEMDLSNVASVTLDAEGACLDGAVPYHVVTDGPTTIELSDGRRLTFTEAGEYEGELAASGAGGGPPEDVPAPDRAPGSGRDLPTTGGGVVAGSMLLLAGAALGRRRR